MCEREVKIIQCIFMTAPGFHQVLYTSLKCLPNVSDETPLPSPTNPERRKREEDELSWRMPSTMS